MFLSYRGLRPLLGAATSIALLSLAGCNAMYGGSAAAASRFTASTVPSVYALVADGNVARATLDHSKESIVLSAALEEYPLPTVWAATANYTAPTTMPATVSGYFKYIQVGLGDTAKVFTAAASGSSVVYTAADGTTLPSATLSSDTEKWYYEAMASGTYYVLTSATALTADNSLVDFTKDASGTITPAVTKVTRWQKSTTDAAWKTGRDEAVAFTLNKVLYGTADLPLTVADDEWKVGVTPTGITKDWALDQYYDTLVDASVTTGSSASGTDATAGASE